MKMPGIRSRRFMWVSLACWVTLLFNFRGVVCAAQNSEPSISQLESYWEEMKESFEFFAQALLSTTIVQPSDSTLNPHNDFAKIPHYGTAVEFRPKLSAGFGRLQTFVKPRMSVEWNHWDEGELQGDSDHDVDVYVNEWAARFRLSDNLILSYGRENIQWGPAYFVSPSNPFFRDNGQTNPKLEVPGMEFARVLWFPRSGWTVSFLANLDKGRQQFVLDNFERTYALKVDWLSYSRYLSWIASYREDGEFRLGGFGNFTISDALLLYFEYAFVQGAHALYPSKLVTTPFGPLILMEEKRADDSTLQETVLLGGSYTLSAGPTLTVEYVFNSLGYDDKEAENYYDFRKMAAEGFSSPYPALQQLCTLCLAKALDPGLLLLRRNYIVFQYQHARIRDVFSVVLRFIHNIDDHSSQFVPYLQYDIGDHSQLFLVGSQNFGPSRSQYRSLIDYGWMFGLQYTF